MTLEELKVLITAETEPLKKGIADVKKQMGRLQNETSKATSGIKAGFKKLVAGVIALKIGQKIGQAIVGGIKEAMNVEAAIQQIKRIMGESTNQFLKWANTQAIAFNMSKAQAIKYGSVFGNLVSTFSKSTQEAMTNTTDLLKASSIIASSTGRSMQDVMERIRSGLLGNTEAIEDLGVHVNVSMIESTEAFQKFANGRSWRQIDFQTQQQIRLMAILEQTTKKYGDAVNQNTSSQLQQLVANLKNVQLSLGQAFLPIVKIVIPMLNTLAQGLSYVMNLIAQFSQALFDKSAGKQQEKNTNAQAKAMAKLGNATEKAGKQAKGALAGFDEINSLGGDDGSSSGVGAGNPLEAPDEPNKKSWLDNVAEVSKEVQKMADKVKGHFNDISKTFKKIWNSAPVQSFVEATKTYGDFLAEYWKTIFGNMGENIANTWNNITPNVSATIKNISSLWTIFWNDVTTTIKEYGPQITKNTTDFLNSVWQDAIDPFIQLVSKAWADFTGGLKDIWDKYGGDLLTNIGELIIGIQETFQLLWDNILEPIIKPFLEMLSWLWDKHLKGLINQIGEFVMKGINAALEMWNGFFLPIINFLVKILGPIFTTVFRNIINAAGTLVAGIADVAKGLLKALGGVLDFISGVFTGNWRKAWQGLKDIVAGIFGALVGVVKVPINLIIDGVNTLIKGLNKIHFETPDWVPFVGGKSFGISIPAIPKLANGGYVGANNPMLAMIGDNKTEGEIVAPESKIYEQTYRAVKDALGGSSSETTLIIQNVIDGEVVTKKVIKNINRKSRNSGKPIVVV